MKTMIQKSLLTQVLVISGTSAAQAAYINCASSDDAQQVVRFYLGDIKTTSHGYAESELQVEIKAAGTAAPLGYSKISGRKGKVALKNGDYSHDLYAESKSIVLSLEYYDGNTYFGQACAPHNNTTIEGIQFIKRDCLMLVCSSQDINTLK